jgi:hypothetical protein
VFHKAQHGGQEKYAPSECHAYNEQGGRIKVTKRQVGRKETRQRKASHQLDKWGDVHMQTSKFDSAQI